LRKVNIKRMVIEGHTDSVGSDEYNQRLSRLRAETLKELLSAELGLNPENVQALGYGESKPIATNDTSKGRQKNRRVILRVYYRNL
jgi:outer membrane protein OmpA-like peptidoglycan-associated protein